MSRWLCCLLACACGCATPRTSPSPGPSSRLAFATRDEAAVILGRRDDYIAALSPFDRASRVKSPTPVSEAEYLVFERSQALEWTAGERAAVEENFRPVADLARDWSLPLPPVVTLVKTNGDEQAGAPYTRGAAICLPRGVVAGIGPSARRMLLHELFHVLSRNHSALRADLYRLIGFEEGEDIELPADLKARKLTNPDGPRVSCVMTIERDGAALHIAPLLLSRSATYDAAQGARFFDYLQVHLLVVERRDGRWAPRLKDGQPELLGPDAVPGFHERIGRNTTYILHPDEILAENFVLLLLPGEKAPPTPELLDGMREVLRRHGATPR
jgi:hypothetical protein